MKGETEMVNVINFIKIANKTRVCCNCFYNKRISLVKKIKNG